MKLFVNVGIITGDQKKVLECYIDSRYFRQRKSFDEYYVDADRDNFKPGINDLQILAEQFVVEVTTDAVLIS